MYISNYGSNAFITNIYINGHEMLNSYSGYLVNPYQFIRISENYGINMIDFSFKCPIDKKCVFPKFYLYEIDNYSFNNAIDILKEQQLNVTKINKNILEGNIEVKKDNQYLFLSIPYEKGWHIYVDGKKVKYEKLFDAFIGIKLNKGYHEIKMKFYPQGLNIGIIISFVSLILIIIYIKNNK